MELFYNIKKIRQLKGYNQTKFAEILGVNNTVLSNWETERGTPSIDMIQKISNIAGISIEDLLNFKIKTLEDINTYENKIPASVIDEPKLEYKQNCRLCFEKDKIIESKNDTIKALKETVDQLKINIDLLKK